MKKSIKINLAILFIFLLAINSNAQDAIYVSYDETYMDKYQYQTENLSSYDFHNAYHIYTSNTDKIILNTAMSSYQMINPAITIQSPTAINWNATLINEINNDLTQLYLVFKEGNLMYSYKVSTAILAQETANKITYSGPYYSYTYDKNRTYNPSEDLAAGKFDIYDETIYMNGTQGDPIDCFQQYNFIKITKETHPKGSFTMIANGDFTKLQSNEIYETCQSALYVDYLENIGIIEERTKNGKIRLIGINGESLNTYLAKRCAPEEYNTTTSTTANSTQPVEGKPGLNFFTRGENTEKSGTVTTTSTTTNQTTTNNDNTTVINTNVATVEQEYELIYTMINTEQQVIMSNPKLTSENTEKGVAGSIVHIVDNGETLYGISRKYGVSVKTIQQLNDLETTEIEVTQALIIKK